jgi:DNA-binding MarR family transcriptional regulator
MSPPDSGPTPGPGLLGTQLQHLLDLLDADVAAGYTDLGLVRDLAEAVGVTHSAASQTVAQMAKQGLVTLTPGSDARQRIVRLTPLAESLLPKLETEWAATTAAAATFEAELSYPLSRLLDEALEALRRRPLRQRIADSQGGGCS